jgi:ferredoxin-fold anticodon binding domain-containing protein
LAVVVVDKDLVDLHPHLLEELLDLHLVDLHLVDLHVVAAQDVDEAQEVEASIQIFNQDEAEEIHNHHKD